MRLRFQVGERVELEGSFNGRLLAVGLALVVLVGSVIAFGGSVGSPVAPSTLSLSPDVPNPGHAWAEVECDDCITQANIGTEAVQEDELDAESVLADLLGVDGAGSELDSDFLDGLDSLDFQLLAQGGGEWGSIPLELYGNVSLYGAIYKTTSTQATICFYVFHLPTGTPSLFCDDFPI